MNGPAVTALSIGGGLILLSYAWKWAQSPYVDEGNVEWLTRIILTEASDPTGKEGVAIGYSALNRVKQKAFYAKNIKEVVTQNNGKTWFGDTETRGYMYVTGQAKRGSAYVTEHPSWVATQQIARGVLAQTIANPIGARTNFVHPWGQPECSTPGEPCGKRTVCVDASLLPGTSKHRCMPLWAVAEQHGGKAKLEPITIYPAVFSKG